MSNGYRAPTGMFAVGETDLHENDWAIVRDDFLTCTDAFACAQTLRGAGKDQLQYYVYDENGLIDEKVLST